MAIHNNFGKKLELVNLSKLKAPKPLDEGSDKDLTPPAQNGYNEEPPYSVGLKLTKIPIDAFIANLGGEFNPPKVKEDFGVESSDDTTPTIELKKMEDPYEEIKAQVKEAEADLKEKLDEFVALLEELGLPTYREDIIINGNVVGIREGNPKVMSYELLLNSLLPFKSPEKYTKSLEDRLAKLQDALKDIENEIAKLKDDVESVSPDGTVDATIKTETRMETYINSDGEKCEMRVTTKTDSEGRVISREETYFDKDGSVSDVYREEFVNGVLTTRYRWSRDGGSDNGREFNSTVITHYDESGNPVLQTQEERYNDNGLLHSSSVIHYHENGKIKDWEVTSYDDNGNVSSKDISYYDDDGKEVKKHG